MLEITVLTYAHTKISSEAREKREKKFSSRKNGTKNFLSEIIFSARLPTIPLCPPPPPFHTRLTFGMALYGLSIILYIYECL